MPVPGSPPWTRRSSSPRQPSYPNPGLRVSDAERAEVVDHLSKHYGEGRLDQAEFNERVDQAMRAKTQADLSGLFADLPEAEAEAPEVPARGWQATPRRHARIPVLRLALLAFVVLIAASIGRALVWSFVPWSFGPSLAGSFVPLLLIGFLAFLWLRRGPRRRP
jgi:Domain of unknown function (DUF1707)